MSDTFDPYREWLKISDPQRPPNHYVLLGLTLYEKDRDRVWDLSLGLMGRVLEFDPGLHCEDARRIFDELEAARDCLCDPIKKETYDASLRATRSAPPPTTAARKSWSSLAAATRGSSVLHAADQHAGAATLASDDSDSAIGRRATEPRRPATHARHATTSRWHWDEHQQRRAAIALGGILIALLLAYFALREPPEHDPVPDLVDQLEHTDPQLRMTAARTLRKLGVRASDAVPSMVQRLSIETNDDVRAAIAEALRESGPAVTAFRRDLEAIKLRETHPGVIQIINELNGK